VVYLPQTLPAGVHLHVLESIIVARHAAGGVRSDSEAEVMSLLRQLGIAHLALSYRPAFRRAKTARRPGPVAYPSAVITPAG
jgi:hypothetical protein